MRRDMQPPHWCSRPSFGWCNCCGCSRPRALRGSGGKHDREQTEGAPPPTSHRPASAKDSPAGAAL